MVISVEEENKILQHQLTSALALSERYREALREVALYGNIVSPTGSMVRSIVGIARRALEGSEMKEVTREELANLITLSLVSWSIDGKRDCENLYDLILQHEHCCDASLEECIKNMSDALLSRFIITERGK